VVGHVHLDVKTLVALLVPLAHVRNPGKEEREAKVNPTLVEALFTGPEAKPASLIDGQIDVDGQMLVCAQIIHNPIALLAENHVRIESAWSGSGKVSDPGDSLPSIVIDVGVVPDRERHIVAAFREHDAPPASDIKKRHGVKRPVPNLAHRSSADARAAVTAGKTKSFLNARMQQAKFISQCLFVD